MAEQPLDSRQVSRTVDVREGIELGVESGEGAGGQIDDSANPFDEAAHARLVLSQALFSHLCAQLGEEHRVKWLHPSVGPARYSGMVVFNHRPHDFQEHRMNER
jgi:xanthine/CO dehydrogenase XdhC/CoxF family maturation factor